MCVFNTFVICLSRAFVVVVVSSVILFLNNVVAALSCLRLTALSSSILSKTPTILLFFTSIPCSNSTSEICPEMQVNEIHALSDKHHELSSSLKSH